MTKSLILLIALVVALAAYAFWPSGDEQAPLVALWPAPPPGSYQLRAPGATQMVDGATVTIGGLRLPLDGERAGRLWSLLAEPAIDASHAVRVGDGDLAAFGLDGTRALTVGALRLQWGERDGRATAWRSDDGRALPLDRSLAARLAQAWTRLDAPPVAVGGVDAIEVDGLALARDGAGRWWAPAAPERPEFTTRVAALLALAGDSRIDDLAGAAADGADLGAARIGDHRLALRGAGAARWLRLDDFPWQALSEPLGAAWTALFAGFARDYLFSPPPRRGDDPVEEVVVTRGGAPWFRLERRGGADALDGRSSWDVLIGGQRLVAAADVAARLEAAFEQVVVAEPRRRTDAAPLAADAITVALRGQLRGEPLTIELGGGLAASASHVGRPVELPPVLAGLTPDRFLDRLPVARSPDRLDKLQRIVHADGTTRGETYVRDARGWTQTFPRPLPVDAVALEALARAVCGLRADAARLATPADRELAERAGFELACRFAPRQAGRATDTAALDETAELELSLAFVHGDHGWSALDADAAIVYDVADATVAELMRPLAERAVWPLAPNLVARVIVSRGAEQYALIRTGESAWAIDADGVRAPADPVAVARWLRDLAGLTADSVDRDAPVLAPEDRVGVVTCILPGFDAGEDRLSLHVGRPLADGVVALSTDRARAVAAGRFRVRADADQLLPPRDRFAPR